MEDFRMPKKLTLLIILISLFIPMSIYAIHFAKWSTSMGSFIAEIRDEVLPITGENFINLTNSGFYNGLKFHRVEQGFVIQDGDPQGNGTGGPGWTIPLEIYPYIHHDAAGVLGMARGTNPNSAGSQYYITLAPALSLDGRYAIFGKVIEGIDVVMAIGDVPVNANHHPITDVTIDTLRILGLNITTYEPCIDTTGIYDMQSPSYFAIDAYDDNTNPTVTWFVDDILQEGQTQYTYQPAFTQTGEHVVKCLVSGSEGFHYPVTWHVNVVGTANHDETESIPSLQIAGNSPNPFSHTTSLNYKTTRVDPVTIRVFDVKGRLIRSTTQTIIRAGDNQWVWDGKDQTGKQVVSGIYLFEASTGNASDVCKVVYIR